MSTEIGKDRCSWCHGIDEHDDEFCNACEFCESPICCVCWDEDYTCYYPGEGYCPSCKKRLYECPDCTVYLNGLMGDPDMPLCNKHLDLDSPDYIGKNLSM